MLPVISDDPVASLNALKAFDGYGAIDSDFKNMLIFILPCITCTFNANWLA